MAELLGERGQQARFADAGFAVDEDELSLARADLAPGILQEADFMVPVHHGNELLAAGRLEPAAAVAFAEDAPCLHMVAESLQLLRAEIVELEQPLGQRARGVVDDDAVGLGHRLQPRGDVRRIADGGDLLGHAAADQFADNDKTGGDADPHLKFHVAGNRQAAH